MPDPFSIVLGGGRGLSQGNELVAGIDNEDTAHQADQLCKKIQAGELEEAFRILKVAYESGTRARSPHLDTIDSAYRGALMSKTLAISDIRKSIRGMLSILDIRSSEADFLVVDEGIMHISNKSERKADSEKPYSDAFVMRCGKALSKKSSTWRMALRGRWKTLPEGITKCEHCQAQEAACSETLEDKTYPLFNALDQFNIMQSFNTMAIINIKDLLTKEDSTHEQVQEAVTTAYIDCLPDVIASNLQEGGERSFMGALSYEVYSALKNSVYPATDEQMMAGITSAQWSAFAGGAIDYFVLNRGDIGTTRWNLRDAVIQNCKSADV